MFGMFADTLARKSEQFSLDVRLHLTCGDAPEARWACFARDGESPTEAERNIYRYIFSYTQYGLCGRSLLEHDLISVSHNAVCLFFCISVCSKRDNKNHGLLYKPY